MMDKEQQIRALYFFKKHFMVITEEGPHFFVDEESEEVYSIIEQALTAQSVTDEEVREAVGYWQARADVLAMYPEHHALYAGNMREKFMIETLILAATAQKSNNISWNDVIYIQYAENGNVRQWQATPFKDSKPITIGNLILRSCPSEHRNSCAALVKALEQIAEGNLGDEKWQANYKEIKRVSQLALAEHRNNGGK